MNIGQLKELLKDVPNDLELWVSDGYEGNDYHGDFQIKVLEGVDGHKFAELEIGGLLVN